MDETRPVKSLSKDLDHPGGHGIIFKEITGYKVSYTKFLMLPHKAFLTASYSVPVCRVQIRSRDVSKIQN